MRVLGCVKRVKCVQCDRCEGDGGMSFSRAAAPDRVAHGLCCPDLGTTSGDELRFEAAGSATGVTGTLDGNIGRNPLFRGLAVFGDGRGGRDFQAGLPGLKARAETAAP